MKSKTRSHPFLRNLATAAFTVAFAGFCPTAHAADYTWDADTVTTGAQAGSGTWNTTTANWWNGTANVVWGAANAAIFAGADATVGNFHDITLAENLTAQKITFNNSGYRLGAASSLALSLTNVGDGVVTVATGKSATLGSNVTVALNAASNTGTRTTLNNGTLEIAAGSTLTRTGQITTGFSASGGTLGFTGTGATINVAGTLSFNVPTPVANGGIVISNSSGNSVTMNVNSGGVVSSNSTINGITVVSANSGVRSGVLTVNSGGLVSTTGTGAVTAGINLANGADSSGTVNLNGGTISTFRINSNYLNTSTNVLTTGGTSTFNFNGGTLKAIANNAAFMAGLTGANVISNSFIDNGGFNVGVGQTLGGAAGMSFQGIGTTTLSGTQTYAGTTNVTAGTLNLQTSSLASNIVVSTGATLAGTDSGTTSGSITVADNATLSVKAATAFSTPLATSGSLALGSGGTTNLTIDFNNFDTSAAFITAGSFAVNGPTNLSMLNGSALTTGQHPLVAYTPASFSGTAPTGTFNFGTRSSGTLVNDNANGLLYLNVTADTPKWTGRDSGAWVVGPTGANSNWKLVAGNNATNYIEGDAVLFDDSAVGTKNVTIATNVSPLSTTFDNSTAYTLSGAAGIATGSFTKNGSGDVTISSANTFPGGTMINDGTITLGSPTGLGSGSVALNGGSLNLNGQSIANAITLSAGNVLGSGSISGVISGFGTLDRSTGTLVLTGTNTYTGSTSITGGTLQIGDGTTDGSIATSSGITNDGSLVYNLVGARTYANPISGTGSLTKQGLGTLTLSSAASSFSGGTTVSAGNLIANPTGLSGGGITVATGATLTSSGGTFSGTVSGAGAVISTAGTTGTTVTGDFSGFSGTYTHNTTLGSSVFNTATATSKNAAYHIATVQALSQGMLAAANGDYTLEIGALSGIANSLFRGGNVATGLTTLQIGNLGTDTTFAGSINNGVTKALALTKVGGGKLTLTGTNNYTGTTTVSGGILAVTGNAILDTGKLIIDGGKVEPTGTEMVGTLFFGATQKAAGTWGASGSGAVNIDDAHFSGTGIVQVGPPAGYSSWATLNGASAVASDDHDNDGVPNGVEYFIGGPTGNTTGFTALPGVTTAAGVRSITWTHAADYVGTYGVDFLVETSATLASGSWTAETSGGNVTLTGNDVKYTFPAGPDKNFVRLRVKAN